jgi:large subunit ribosomal protein L9
LPATAGNTAAVEEFKRLAAARAEAARKQALATAEQLGTVSVKITRAVGEENKMYGSVTSKDIESAYADKGITVDRKLMDLQDPIRTLGLTEVRFGCLRMYPRVAGRGSQANLSCREAPWHGRAAVSGTPVTS